MSYRWLRVSEETGKPVGPRVSYPSEGLCRAFCKPGEAPALAEVVGRPGPFQDHLKLVVAKGDGELYERILTLHQGPA